MITNSQDIWECSSHTAARSLCPGSSQARGGGNAGRWAKVTWDAQSPAVGPRHHHTAVSSCQSPGVGGNLGGAQHHKEAENSSRNISPKSCLPNKTNPAFLKTSVGLSEPTAVLVSSKLCKALEWLINTTWKNSCFNPDLENKFNNTAKKRSLKNSFKKVNN